ncbi:hypothetical protein D1BOALGB6SA_1950 [Olavius sp. associated proteobacterium Delta 1]|nr:hypothetical protein D1BOALGB6SA_1950 [Olavius sp. associated proteobacterium Delta 1]
MLTETRRDKKIINIKLLFRKYFVFQRRLSHQNTGPVPDS